MKKYQLISYISSGILTLALSLAISFALSPNEASAQSYDYSSLYQSSFYSPFVPIYQEELPDYRPAPYSEYIPPMVSYSVKPFVGYRVPERFWNPYYQYTRQSYLFPPSYPTYNAPTIYSAPPPPQSARQDFRPPYYYGTYYGKQ